MGLFSNIFGKGGGSATSERIEVTCPLAGELVDISTVNDPVFSSLAMGDGVAIKPTEGVLLAPISGTVEALFPTGHALAIKGDNGVSIMLHIGIDTVEMKGDGFTAHVAAGDHVSRGQKLVDFDLGKIAQAGFDPITMVIAAENTSGKALHKHAGGAVSTADIALWFE